MLLLVKFMSSKKFQIARAEMTRRELFVTNFEYLVLCVVGSHREREREERERERETDADTWFIVKATYPYTNGGGGVNIYI